MKQKLKSGAVVLGAAALFAAGGMGTAVASKMITGDDIASHTITQKNLAKHSIGANKLKDNVGRGERGPEGPQGPQGDPASDVKGGLAADETSEATTIANIGGSFGKFTGTVRATELDTVHLEAGQYVLSADGYFHSTEATSGQTRLQLALRIADGTDWGKDVGTCFTGAASALADREITCHTDRVVSLDAPADVKVYGFGYADDQGSADSGKFTGQSFVNAIKVG